MPFVIAPQAQVVIPVEDERYSFFPVNRVFGIGANYPLADGTVPTPFFFMKSPDTIAPVNRNETLKVPYPAHTKDLRHEVEVVVALGKGGKNLSEDEALDAIWGYAVGLDLTAADAVHANGNRDMMGAKNFERSSPVSCIRPHWRSSLPAPSEIWLYVNNKKIQSGSTDKLTMSILEQIMALSQRYELQPGDILFTGTPDGVSPLKTGDIVECGVNGVGQLRIEIN